MKAFILAGGKGTRLRPLTNDIPKPLILINKRPLLEYNILLLKKYNIRNILISIGYKGEKIKDYFGDGSKIGVNITYISEEKPLGTAGPLKLAKDLLTETFVMLNADDIKDINLKEMYEFHKKHNGLSTIALTPVNDPSMYGVAKLDGDKIIQFVEKPKPGEEPSNLINAGLYILEPEVINMIPKSDYEIKIETEIFPKLAKLGKLYGYKFNGFWADAGTLERYEKIKKEFESGKIKLSYINEK